MKQHLTQPDHWLLETLTLRLRVVTEDQLHTAKRSSRRRLHALKRLGLVQAATVPIGIPDIRRPLLVWTPGDPEPRCASLAWQLQKRWVQVAPKPQVLYWATSKAARATGGVGGRLRQPLQLAHDLGVAAVYLQRIVNSTDELHWLGEDAYRRECRPARREKVPDAVEMTGDGRLVRVIEFGGAYQVERIDAFHRYWSRQQIPYELW